MQIEGINLTFEVVIKPQMTLKADEKILFFTTNSFYNYTILAKDIPDLHKILQALHEKYLNEHKAEVKKD